MSELLEIQNQIDAANARIASLEHSLVQHPGYPSIAANLDSAVRVLKKLEAQFIEATAQLGMDVCRYRAFNDFEMTRTADAFTAISEFQRVVSVVYAAKKYGMKARATIPGDVAKDTQFGFGYAFRSSIGVMLTVRSDNDIFGESYLEESIHTIFDLVKATKSSDIKAIAESLGPGPVNAIYQWAQANVASGLGADIEWRHGSDVRNSLFVQRQELYRLANAIEKTSSQKQERLEIDGTLTAADASKMRFKLAQQGLPEISGTVENGVIDEEHTVGLPRRYVAVVLKTTRTRYSTGEVRVRYHLVRLSPVK